MSSDRQETITGCFGCVWGEAIVSLTFVIALITAIVVFLLRIHARATLGQAFGTALKDAFLIFCVTTVLLVVTFLTSVYIDNWRRRKK